MKQYVKDQVIECSIMSIDVPYERVIASVRRLHEDTTEAKTAKLVAEESLSGLVKAIKRDGVEVALDNLQVYIDKGDLSKNQPLQSLNIGDAIEFRVLSFDKDRKEYKGSVNALESTRKDKIVHEFSDKSDSTSFGKIMSSALEDK